MLQFEAKKLADIDADARATTELDGVSKEASTRLVDTNKGVVAEVAGIGKESVDKVASEDGLSLTPNEINRVYQLSHAKATPFFALVTPQNLFRFGIGPNLAVIPPPPPVIDVDSSSTESNEDVATSSKVPTRQPITAVI
ncbi:unnamed protein product [Ilex paraguariensis]|uniref:Uncharacterized protein n=1 Tax=Ilex paraguariensis TaxID=185542 RepID=A0ABC8TQH1_9AQUA